MIPCADVELVNWGHLKNRLLSSCPSSSFSFYFDSGARAVASPRVFLLKVLCIDRTGLLNGMNLSPSLSFFVCVYLVEEEQTVADYVSGCASDVAKILGELELIIQRVKVSTTPDGRVVDFFFITDGM